MVEIKIITAQETLRIRQKVLWPNYPIEQSQLVNDEQGRHFGLFVDEQLISVISLFIVNNAAQFRKFATLDEYQGKGYGSRLLDKIFTIAQLEKIDRIWCNARKKTVSYYKKFGMKETKTTFIKNGVAYVIMERILLDKKQLS